MLALLRTNALAVFPWTLSSSGAVLIGTGLYVWVGGANRNTSPYFYLALLGALFLALGPYLRDYLQHHSPRRARLEACLIPLFCASMVALLLLPFGYYFLFFWELMALLGFVLICLEEIEGGRLEAGSGKPESNDVEVPIPATLTLRASTLLGARWFFLASRFSGAGLLLAFILALRDNRALPEWLNTLVWVGLLIGFGTKAALFPFSLWLPRSHPVAISPLSALLSAGMTKLGLYGLFRAPDWMGRPPSWVDWTLIVLGLIGAVYALVRGLSEQDYKGVLAYSSIENLNLLLVMLGAYWLTGQPLFLLAFFYHQLAHALFKGTLFMASGVLPSQSLGQLGGVWAKAPFTAGVSLVAAVAAAGLPPLAGFMGEWYLVLGLLKTGSILILAVGVLGLVGALALVLYVRSFGLVFLGAPRSEGVADTAEATPGMRLGLFSLVGQLVLLALLPAQVLSGFGSVLTYPVVPISIAMVLLGFGLWRWLRRWPKRLYNTWDGGYGLLEPRMQPSGLGYSELALRLFPGFALKHTLKPRDLLEELHGTISNGYVWLAGKFQGLQSGSIHLYLMLQFVALLIVLGVAFL